MYQNVVFYFSEIQMIEIYVLGGTVNRVSGTLSTSDGSKNHPVARFRDQHKCNKILRMRLHLCCPPCDLGPRIIPITL